MEGFTEPEMSKVMTTCSNAKFAQFNACVQNNYARDPNANSVGALYSLFNAIEEDIRLGKMTETRGVAEANRAYAETVGASNARSSAAAANYYNANKTRTCVNYGGGIIQCY